MASFGISFCIFLIWQQPLSEPKPAVLLLAPLGWIFEPTSPAWRVAANTRDYYFLGRWEWYDWLGVFAPFAILWWFRRIGQNNRATVMVHVTSRLIAFGIFQLIVAVALMLPQSLERIRPLQPMRYLHLFYLIFIIVSGGLLGQKFLRNHWLRWVVVFVPLAAGNVLRPAPNLPKFCPPRMARIHSQEPVAASLRLDPREHAIRCLFRRRSRLHAPPRQRLPQLPRPGRTQRAGRCSEKTRRSRHKSRASQPAGSKKSKPKVAGSISRRRITNA